MVNFGGFFPKLGYIAGFFLYYLPERSAKLRWVGQKGKRTYSNMMSCTPLSRIVSKTGTSTGFSLYKIFTGRNSKTVIFSNMLSCTALSRIFSKTRTSSGFSLYNIFIGRNSKAAMAWGEGNIIVFRLQHSSIRVQRSSVGCSVAQKSTA